MPQTYVLWYNLGNKAILNKQTKVVQLQRLSEGGSNMSKRQSELHGNMQNKAETTLSPIMGKNRSKWDHLLEKYSVEEIHRLHYEENYTPVELGRYTGIDRRALVQYYFYRYGMKPNKKFKGNPPEIYDKEWLVEQLQTGHSVVDIAKKLGTSPAYVYKWCNEKHNINIKKQGLINRCLIPLQTYPTNEQEKTGTLGKAEG